MESYPAEHNYPYYCEVEDIDSIDLTEEDLIRGSKFINGLSLYQEAFTGVEFTGNDYVINLRNALMIVQPQSPVMRTVMRSDGFYEWTVRPEITESISSLAIETIEILPPSNKEWQQGFIRAHSPSYRYRYGSGEKPLKEVYTFNPSLHRVAIHLK